MPFYENEITGEILDDDTLFFLEQVEVRKYPKEKWTWDKFHGINEYIFEVYEDENGILHKRLRDE